MSPTKDGLDFEAIAKGIYKTWLKNDFDIRMSDETPIDSARESLIDKINRALQQAYAEGLKKSVVAKVPSAIDMWAKAMSIQKTNVNLNGPMEDVKVFHAWLIEQIKAVELKMPVRRHLDDSVLANKYDYFGNEGFNDALDQIEQMNPELFGDIKK